jgi:IS5 family transposase
MRQKFTPQMSLFSPMARNSIVKELEQVSKILDTNPHVLQLVYEDLVRTSRPDTGRQGLTAEQVLRSAVLKQYRELTYEENWPFTWRTLMPSAPSPVWRWDNIPQSQSSRRTSR